MAIDLGLTGARALVVGAGLVRAGHGRGSALNLGDAGATVACLDLKESRAAATAQAIIDRGGKAFPVVGDVRDSDNITRAIDEAAEHLGGLDVVVDVPGGATWNMGGELTNEEWDSQILFNLTQVFYVFRASVPYLIRGGIGSSGSSFIMFASADGLQSSVFHAVYGAAKAGIVSLAKSWGEEYGRYGVRVNVVAPGNVGAGNFEHPPADFGSDVVNPLAPPRGTDLSDAVLFLASKLSDRITGQTILVDGGAVSRSAWNFGNLEDLARVPGMGVSDYDSEDPDFPNRSSAETVGE